MEPSEIKVRKRRRVKKHSKKGILSKLKVSGGKINLLHIAIALVLAVIVGIMLMRNAEKEESAPTTIEQR